MRTTTMPFRLLVDEAMRRLKPVLRRVYIPFATFYAVVSLLLVLFQVGWTQAIARGDFALGCGGGVLYLVALMLTFVGYVAMAVIALDSVAGRPIDLGRAFRFPFRPRVFGTLLLVGLLTAVAYVMCLLPVLYVLPLLTLVLPVMVEEGLSGTVAIERSARLVGLNPLEGFPKNSMIKILTLTCLGMVLSMSASMISQMPFEIVRQVAYLRSAGAAQDPLAALTSPGALALQCAGAMLGALATTVVSFYSVFAVALLFHDIRARREGGDLERDLTALEARRGLTAPEPVG